MTVITFIGAGSVVFNKNLLGDILSYPELQNSTIRLHDIDPIRLETAEVMAHQIAEKLGASPTIQADLNRKRSLEAADYVINMIGVGGHTATLVDFDVPRRYGLRQTIGDTHSIGGIFRALRTVPVMLEIARDMDQLCPRALFLNYTNPMSMLCRAMFEATSIRIVGLCHSVQGTVAQISRYCGLSPAEVTFKGAGINHMSWILRFEHLGEDAYPILRQAIEENRIPKTDLVRAELFRRLGFYVTESSEHLAEYLSYFIPKAEQVEKFNVPLDEYIRRSERGLKEFDDLRVKVMRGDPIEVRRSAEYASQIIHAIETGQPTVIYGNVRNDGLIDNLPHGCCVEVPCLVDSNGIQPTRTGALPPQLAGMNLPHIAVQELAVRGALEGRRDYIYQAAMLDPLISATLTLDQIWAMVDEMICAHGTAIPEGIRTEKPASNFIAQEPELLRNQGSGTQVIG